MATFTATVHAMAMPFGVALDDADPDACERAVAGFESVLVRADELFSLWDDDSYVRHLLRGDITLDDGPPELREILEACEWYRVATDGGFDARRPDGAVDPTGLVKGWAVARGARHLRAARASDWRVSASGDVLVGGGRTRRIGIADPRVKGDPAGSDVVDVVELGGAFTALATSGGAQAVDHIWDPATGEVARHFLQVSVAGTELTECDAWATAIAGGGPRVVGAALERGLEVLLITGGRHDGTYDSRHSPGWPSVR